MSFRASNVLSIFLLAATALILLYGPTTYNYRLPVVAFCLCIAACMGATWLIRRGLIDRAPFPQTGLEGVMLAFLGGILLSMLASQGSRAGLERLAWFLAAGLLFYALVDLFRKPENRIYIRGVLLFATTPLLFHALAETYVRYLVWWDQAGTTLAEPPFPMRFSSLLGHSNIFMAVANLIAPMAVVMFLTTRKRIERIACAFWLVMFAAALPFSSSRGGWIGMAVWISLLGTLWLMDHGRWKKPLEQLQRSPALSLSGGLTFAVLLVILGVTFYNRFAATNPSHGSALSLNRKHIWIAALHAWRASPWTGSGLGRLGLEMMVTAGTFPASWWPMHAHSVPLQILSETGLIGFLPFIALSLSASMLFHRAYHSAVPGERLWIAASLASLAGVFIHGIFEDLTSPLSILFVVAFHAAYILGAGGMIHRSSRGKLLWLSVPGAVVLGIALFNIWSRVPLYQSAEYFSGSDWHSAAQAAEASYLRDPQMPFYSAEAGMAYAAAWGQSGDPGDLQRARLYLLTAATLEPNSSLLWANLAVVNWHSAFPQEALDAIQRAIALCPRESGYYINYGWFLEQLGQHQLAQEQYRLALKQDRNIFSHPFWSSSTDRSKAVELIQPGGAHAPVYWETALALLASGDVPQARYALAVSSLYQEPITPRTLAWLKLMIQEGDPEAIRSAYQSLVSVVRSEYSSMPVSGGVYGSYFMRNGLWLSTVPGYIRVTEDVGQFAALEQLHELQIAEGDYAAASITLQALQRGMRAGEWNAEGNSIARSLQH